MPIHFYYEITKIPAFEEIIVFNYQFKDFISFIGLSSSNKFSSDFIVIERSPLLLNFNNIYLNQINVSSIYFYYHNLKIRMILTNSN